MANPSILLDDQSQLIDWAQGQLGIAFFNDARAIGWGAVDDIRAVAVYERWTGNDCCVHLVSDNRAGWLSRTFIHAGFHYPFAIAGLRRITGLVPASNTRALRLNLHFGYRREGVLRHGAEDGGDIVVMGMLREECRFIKSERTDNG